MPPTDLPPQSLPTQPTPVALETQRARAAGSPKRRLTRRLRRLGSGLVYLTPVLVDLGVDFHRRSKLILAFRGEDAWAYVGTVAVTALVGALFVHAISRRRSPLSVVMALLFVLYMTLTIGGQGYFFQEYRAYLNEDVSVFASNLMDSVINQLLADLPNYASFNVPPLVLSLGVLLLARRVVRPRRWPHRITSALVVGSLVWIATISVKHRQIQAATPAVLYLNATGGLVRTQLGLTEQAGQVRPRARNSTPVPPIRPTLPVPRNVILVQLESVRADSTCMGYKEGCRRTETTNELFPHRLPLRQMRSLASSTAICSATLWGGLLPSDSRERLHTFPLIFDYAKAAGYHTAYYTAQNMMFGNARLWVKNLGVERFLTATDFEPQCDLDMGAPERIVAERLVKEFQTMPEPFFITVQLSNVHYPYYIDKSLPQPFQPASLSKAPEDIQDFYYYYQNSIYQQDIHVGRFLSALRATEAGKRTVIVYTSDHGEAFREHGNLGHTFSVLDNETHVPTWIDAPPGILASDEIAALKSFENQPTTHLDLNATMLDLLGLWKAPEIAEYTSQIPGDSLLRPERAVRTLPMTNCAWVWSCAFENWGVLRGNRKLEAREWDTEWHCYDLERDPKEQDSLGADACPDLVEFAMKTFGRRPGELKQKAAAAK